MDSEYPFVLLGDHFYLSSFLEHNPTTGLFWRNSILHRGASGTSDQEVLANIENTIPLSGIRDIKTLKKAYKHLQNISAIVGFGITYIGFDFKGGTLLNSRISKYQNYDLTKAALEIIVKNKSLFKGFRSENIIYGNRLLPLIPGSDLEQILHLKIITACFKDLDPKIFDGDEQLFILSGELVWSGWLSTAVLLKLIAEKFPRNNYYQIDHGGIWQYLIYGKDPERFKINKSIFEPELFCMELSQKINKKPLTLDLEGRKKKIYLSGDTKFFDLKEPGWNFNSLVLPRYLLVKGSEQKNSSQIPWWKDQTIKFPQQVTFSNSHYRIWSLEQGYIQYYCDPSQDCTRELQSWVDRNDTIGVFDQLHEEQLALKPKIYEIMVVDGQILKKGAVIAVKKGGGIKISAKFAGKVVFSDPGTGLVSIVKDKIKTLIRAPFPGILSSFSRSSGFRIATRILSIPLEYQSEKNFMGKVAGGISIFQDAAELLQKFKQDGLMNKYGVLVKTATFRQIAELSTTLNGRLPFAIVNCVTEQLDKELDRFLGRLADKFISCEKGILKIPWVEVEECFKQGFFEEPDQVLRKGTEIKFINYECQSFYGKIEKRLNPVENTYSFLINSQGDFYECPRENILLLDHIYE